MKKSIISMLIGALFVTSLFTSCTTLKKATQFPGMYDEKPVVMLIMPPINKTNYVEAKDFFYTTMNVPVAESGYYVLPPAACYSVMQREGAYNSERFIDGSLKKFNELFGADVCVFTTIKSWDKSLVGSSVTVEVEYTFKSTKTNETLYHRDAKIICDTSSNTRLSGFGLVGTLINLTSDAVKTAVTDYVSVAVMCNKSGLQDLPAGKYSSKYGTDGETSAMADKITIRASK
ncbi:GNA1162 family protein [Treponema zioleckii]|uniref:GNA1162 family protein n=1 Tax=Treponema zioleckii TaxID=331680 RepID=UPI00168B0555|nr:GNA1162 family protein [Treponema zioleckii]